MVERLADRKSEVHRNSLNLKRWWDVKTFEMAILTLIITGLYGALSCYYSYIFLYNPLVKQMPPLASPATSNSLLCLYIQLTARA
jgi:hypothetical protein